MDATLVKAVVAGVLGAHGLGHVMGWMPALGVVRLEGVSGSSQLLAGVVGEGAMRIVAVGLFALPTIGFVAAAVGLLLGPQWWRPVAAASATVSLAATALFPNAFPLNSTIGSLAVNGLVLYGLLVADWNPGAAGD
jgi:hypothetical protein